MGGLLLKRQVRPNRQLGARDRRLGLARRGWIARHRLIVSGVFDRLPNLQMIIGHMGEMIPFSLERIEYELKTLHT